MSEGHHFAFYFVKNLAMVSLQILIVYINWFFLFPLLFKRKHYLAYGLCSLILVYLAFIFSFSWIEIVLKVGNYFSPSVSVIDFPSMKWLYPFWSFLSGSAPYSLSLVCSLVLKILHENNNNKKLAEELKLQKVKTEIQYLRSQINPHFLFNSLNNIHTLILKKPDQAADYTILLSDLLRYMLYEVKKEETDLSNEIQCLKNYFELVAMRMEYPDSIKLTVEIKNNNIKIVPLLLISLVENGIKHSGIEHDSKAWLKVSITENRKELKLMMENSIQEKRNIVTRSKTLEGVTLDEGIGLGNLKKRLALNYADQYDFALEKKDEKVITRLSLNLNS